MAALLTTDFNIPNDIATGIFEKAQKGSTLAQLSGARPQKFGTQQVWVLTSAPKAELVGEAVQKSPTPAAYSSKTITPLKLQVTMRFSQEVKWADEDTQIGVLQDLSTNAGIALGRALKSKFKAAITTVKGLDWKGTGTNVVSSILNGMYNWGSKLKSWVSSLLSKAQNALGIASPSTLFRDEVGLFRGLLLCMALGVLVDYAQTWLDLGQTVTCYGYYTSCNGTDWYYVVSAYGGVEYTGFCSSKHLSKKLQVQLQFGRK